MDVAQHRPEDHELDLQAAYDRVADLGKCVCEADLRVIAARALRRAAVAERRARMLEVLTAWEAGELSEGQACHLLGTDPVSAREMLQEALAAARSQWEKWRACNPPSPAGPSKSPA